jgi:hypothetical protein
MPRDVGRAMEKLKSLHDGDAGVVEVIACGRQAIPALRTLLYERDPSGLYYARCRAAEALAALGERDGLREFLAAEHSASDPIERAGNEAVMNTVALSLAGLRDLESLPILLRLAEEYPYLTGVIGALGSFHRPESIRLLVGALGEDSSRVTAEAALKQMGDKAKPALLATACLQLPSPERESVSSLRRRRSALGLLNDLGAGRDECLRLRSLMDDPDTKIAFLSCKICASTASAAERQSIAHKLRELESKADRGLSEEIRNFLSQHLS